MTLLRLAQWIERTVSIIGRAVAWLSVLLVLTGFTVVVLRYGFHFSRAWMQELTTYLHAAIFMIGAAYTLQYDGHVRVTIFYDRFSAKTRAYIDVVSMLLIVVPLCALIHWASIDYVLNSWSMQEGSRSAQGLHIVYILKTYIWVFADLLALAAIARAITRLGEITGHRSPGCSD